MQLPENCPTRARTIGGVEVQVPQPYAEGHPLTKAEADMLNQTFSENISNNMRSKATGEDGAVLSTEAFQPLIDEYVAGYEPGVRQGGGGGGARALTPVEVEVRNLATAKLKEVLKAKGLKQKDINFVEVRDKIINDHRDALTAQAEKVVRAREKAAGSAEDDIFASITDGLPGVASTAEAGAGEEEAAA
jgi:hypothetical protein